MPFATHDEFDVRQKPDVFDLGKALFDLMVHLGQIDKSALYQRDELITKVEEYIAVNAGKQILPHVCPAAGPSIYDYDKRRAEVAATMAGDQDIGFLAQDLGFHRNTAIYDAVVPIIAKYVAGIMLRSGLDSYRACQAARRKVAL